MSIETQIQELLDKAAPLRLLPEDEQGELGAIVDQINQLRALPPDAEPEAIDAAISPKRRGRPPKA